MTLKGQYNKGEPDMFEDLLFNSQPYHKYYLFSTGTTLKGKYYNTRKEAEIAMHNYCIKHNITVECTEYDKHERKYSNHHGIRFYINRV